MQQLADIVGTTPQSIHRLEVGETALTTEWAERLAKALGCHPIEFVDWEYPEYEQWELDLIKVFRSLPAKMRYISMLEAIFASMHFNAVENMTGTADDMDALSKAYSEVVRGILDDSKTKDAP